MLTVYENDPYFVKLDTAFEYQAGLCGRGMRRYAANLFASSVDAEGLPDFEEAYGLNPAPDSDANERRAALLAKLRSDGLFTREAVDRIASETVGEHTITEEPGKVTITCHLLGPELSDMQEALKKLRLLTNALNAVKPLHIELEIENE